MASGKTPTARRKVSSATAASTDKHELFTKWAKERGVEIGSVKQATLPGRGFGLMTTGKIEKNERILFVPEKAMFKPEARMLRKQSASPQAQLTLSVLSEITKPTSPYHVWKETWPTIADFQSSLPMFWKSSLQELLPESVQQPLRRQKEDFQKDLDFAMDTLSETSTWNRQDFEYCWAIVNSRSFHFKPPGSRPGFMVLCPWIDYMNHGPSGTTVNVRQMARGYEVVADRDYDAGEEILATYGSHSNDKLLVHYGFVTSYEVGDPTDDDVRLDSYILPHLSSQTKEQLQDTGYLGSYALLPQTNEICFKTQVAIRAELLTSNEWEYFIGNGEDMTSNQDKKVERWLVKLLKPYEVAAREILNGLTDRRPEPDEAPMISLVKARWSQIVRGLRTYIDASD